MGHQRLGTLPTTRPWKRVVALITGGAAAAEIAAEVAAAAQNDLKIWRSDRALWRTILLLVEVPAAARSPDFGAALGKIGVEVSSAPDLIELISAVGVRIDREGNCDPDRSDAADLSMAAACEALFAQARPQGRGLPGTSCPAEDCRASVARLANPRGFGSLAQTFFGRLLFRHQAHYLSRVLGDSTALQGRLQSLKDHNDFERAMELHAAEAAVILHDYAVGWYGKALAAEWRGQSKRVTVFVNYALEKLHGELEIRGMATANGR